jgi:hypothetical protein
VMSHMSGFYETQHQLLPNFCFPRSSAAHTFRHEARL